MDYIIGCVFPCLLVLAAIFIVSAARPVVFFYGLFFWISFLLLPLISGILGGGVEYIIDRQYLYLSAASVVFLSIMGVFSGIQRAKAVSTQFEALPTRLPFRWIIASALLCCWLVKTAILVRYNIFFAGTGVAEVAEAVPQNTRNILSLFRLLELALVIYCAASLRDRPYLVLIVGIVAIFGFLSGGRSTVIFFGACAAYVVSRRLRPKITAGAVTLSLCAVGFFLIVTPIWVRARVLLSVYGEDGLPFVPRILQAFGGAIESLTDRQDFLSGASDNLSQRGNPGLFLMQVMDRCPGPLGGEALAMSLGWALPRQLFGKPSIYPEEIVQESCGLPVHDEATSIIAYFFADFGIVGILLAAAVLGLLLGASLKMALSSRLSIMARTIILSMFFNFSISQESEVISLLVVMRDAFICICIWEICVLLAGTRRRQKSDGNSMARHSVT